MTESSFGARFGKLVRYRRGTEGYTQEGLALEAFGDGKQKVQISRLERGKVAAPHQKTIDALCVVLGITPQDVEDCRTPPAPQFLSDGVDRNVIELLALRFGHTDPDAPTDQLVAFLKATSTAHRALLKEEHERKYRPLREFPGNEDMTIAQLNGLLAEKVVIVLQGKNIYGEQIYSYLEMTIESLQKLKAKMRTNGNFMPSDFGTVIAAGKGDPSPELKAEMTEKYNLIDVPKASRS